MLFHSFYFLFLFLPVVLFLYFITGKYYKSLYEYILVAAGIFFYAYWDILLSPIIIISIVCNFSLGNLIKKNIDKGKKKKILIFSIIFNIIFLAVFKYADFLIQNLNFFLNTEIDPINLPFPLAISFVTFQTIAYLVDCYVWNIAKNNLIRYSLFVIFFPQLIAGPIVRYNDIVDQIKNRTESIVLFRSGIQRFLVGLFKKIIIAKFNLCLRTDVKYGLFNFKKKTFRTYHRTCI